MKYLIPALAFLLTTASYSPVALAQVESMAPVKEAEGDEILGSSVDTEYKRENAPKDDSNENAGAEKADKKTDSLDPVSGPIPLSDVNFYNLHERRVRYRGTDKEFRNSIEARRAAFEQPNTDAMRAAMDKTAVIFADENAESMRQNQAAEAIRNAPQKAPVPPIPGEEDVGLDDNAQNDADDSRPIVPLGEPGDGMDQAPKDLKAKEEISKQADASGAAKPAGPLTAGDKGAATEAPKTETSKTEAPKAEEKPVATTASDAAAPAKDVKPVSEPATGAETAPTTAGKEGVKEIEVKETKDPGEPDKKIVVPEDAPDFEKAPEKK